MNIQTIDLNITARHTQLTNAMRDYVYKKLESISMDFPRITHAHVILDVSKYRYLCEIVLTCTSHIHLQANHESEDLYASIDRCMLKLGRQMRRHKTRVQDNNRHPVLRSRRWIKNKLLPAEKLDAILNSA